MLGPRVPGVQDLSGYVPYTGATTDVDLGLFGLSSSNNHISSTHSGTSSYQPFDSIHTINTPAGNDTFGYAGIYSGTMDTHAQSGVIEDATMERSGFEVNYTRVADSSVDWQDGGEVIRGYGSYVLRQGAVTGLSHSMETTGFQIITTNDCSYNNASGNYSLSVYGIKALIQSNGNLSAGTLNKNVYGMYLQVGSNDAGTSNAYGLYITNVAGADNNYAIYSNSTATSFFNGDITVPDESYGIGWDGSLEVPTKNAIYDKIETLSSGGGNSVSATLAFGGSFTDKAQTVITGQSWVTANSEIVTQVKTPSGTDPDEMILLGLKTIVSNLVAGDGFTVTVYSDSEARGSYDVMCIGV